MINSPLNAMACARGLYLSMVMTLAFLITRSAVRVVCEGAPAVLCVESGVSQAERVKSRDNIVIKIVIVVFGLLNIAGLSY